MGWCHPKMGMTAVRTARDYLLEMLCILPPVVIMIGLLQVWVSEEWIQRFAGKRAGVRGFLLCMGFGMLPTGPLYLAFPIAAALLQKGVPVRNIVAFLTAWAGMKIPQFMLETQFLGLQFTLLHFLLTGISAIFMSLVIEALYHFKK